MGIYKVYTCCRSSSKVDYRTNSPSWLRIRSHNLDCDISSILLHLCGLLAAEIVLELINGDGLLLGDAVILGALVDDFVYWDGLVRY